LALPNIAQLSPAELLEYRALLSKMIECSREYASLTANLEASYRLMLGGVEDADTLIDAINKPKSNH
jgi:hypothetical protein